MLIPKFTRPFASDLEGSERAYVAFLTAGDLGTFPRTISGATVFQTDTIYLQGFNQFQGWLNASGGGTLAFAYGICHPETFAVLGYRTLVTGAAPSSSMILTWGVAGQSLSSLNGDLYTVIVLRFTAATGSVTLNNMVFWCGLR